MRTWFAGIAVTTAVLMAACGGNTSSPMSPSSMTSTSAPSTTGATVNGTVRLGATAADVGSAADPMKVEIPGTNIVATVSGAGQFQLTNVPAGQVQLHFFGAGANATVTLSAVSTGQTVNITVTVVGNSAAIETEEHNGGSDQEIEGRIESLPPTQPAGTLVVAGQTITTNGQTIIRQGSVTKSFTDLQVGQRVHVKGSVSGTTFLASLIEIQNTQTNLPVEVNGAIDSLTGNELAFQFKVGSQLVKGDNLTVFFGGSTFTDLKNGVQVEVKGEQRDGFVYADRIHVNGTGGDNGNNDNEVELSGALSALGGTCPAVTFTLGGKTVVANSSTRYEEITCADLKNTLAVEVEGQTQSDGSVLATKISGDNGGDNQNGSVDLEGALSGLTGTCPAVSFTLQGKSVFTNSSTNFKGLSCGDLANTLKIDVKGQTQSNGTVLAIKIEKD